MLLLFSSAGRIVSVPLAACALSKDFEVSKKLSSYERKSDAFKRAVMRRAATFEPDTGGVIEIVTDEVKEANEEHLRLWFAHVRFAISDLNPSEKADLFFVPSEFTRSWLELAQASVVDGTENDMEFYTCGQFLCKQLLRTYKFIIVPVWAQGDKSQHFTLLCISKLESDELSIRYYDLLH